MTRAALIALLLALPGCTALTVADTAANATLLAGRTAVKGGVGAGRVAVRGAGALVGDDDDT